ncbi:MAG: hypothetical protein BRD51_00395, partial [Bacteroidetes bacterium SW_11_64_17]
CDRLDADSVSERRVRDHLSDMSNSIVTTVQTPQILFARLSSHTRPVIQTAILVTTGLFIILSIS